MSPKHESRAMKVRLKALSYISPIQSNHKERKNQFGCFVVEGEGSIMKLLKDLNMKLDLQTTEIMQLKAKVADHEVTISDHENTISHHENMKFLKI